MRVILSFLLGIFVGAFFSYKKGVTNGRVQQRSFDEPIEEILQRKKK
jgi:hypothetical protein